LVYAELTYSLVSFLPSFLPSFLSPASFVRKEASKGRAAGEKEEEEVMEVADRRNRETSESNILKLPFCPSSPSLSLSLHFYCARTLLYKNRPTSRKKTARQLREHPAFRIGMRILFTECENRREAEDSHELAAGCLIAPKIPSNDPKSGGSARQRARECARAHALDEIHDLLSAAAAIPTSETIYSHSRLRTAEVYTAAGSCLLWRARYQRINFAFRSHARAAKFVTPEASRRETPLPGTNTLFLPRFAGNVKGRGEPSIFAVAVSRLRLRVRQV